MAIAFGRALGTGAINSSGTTVVITTSATANIGEWIVVRVATDNLSATTPTFTCADSAGNTYAVDIQGARNASAGAGIAGGVFSAPVTSTLASGQTITVTLSGATFAKASVAEAFTGVGGRRASGTNSANGASVSPTVTLTTPVSGDLVIGHIAHESFTAPSAYDTDTTNGSWSTGAVHPSAVSGTDNQRVQVVYQYKIVTGTGSQTYNATVVNADWIAFEVAYTPTAGPNQGSATGAVSWTGSATGTTQRRGAGTGSITWTGSATGARTPKGASTGSIAWTGTATGARIPKAAGTGSIAWTGSATGEAPAGSVKQGAATGTILWAGTAQGTTTRTGSATGTITWAGTSTGRRMANGAAAGTVTWTGTATGGPVRTGTGTGGLSWVGSATGLAQGGLTGTVLNDADALYLEDVPVDRVYVGTSLVWP